MKKYKLLICMLMTAVAITACGNNDEETPSDVPTSQETEDSNAESESKEEDTDEDTSSEEASETTDPADATEAEEDPDAADLSEGNGSQSLQQGSYEGLTLKDMLDNEFKMSGFMAMSMGDSGAVSIQLTKDLEVVSLSLSNLDMETYEEFNNLEDSEAKYEFIEEHFSDTVLDQSNYTIQYMIYSTSDLQTAVEKGIYEIINGAQGKTLGDLLDEGYEYDGYSAFGNDCLLNMSDGNGKYIILIDRSEKGEELDLFGGDVAELLRDYTVVEGYMLTAGSNTNSNNNSNTSNNTSEGNNRLPYLYIPM